MNHLWPVAGALFFFRATVSAMVVDSSCPATTHTVWCYSNGMCCQLWMTVNAPPFWIAVFQTAPVSAGCLCSVATMTGIHTHSNCPACLSALCRMVLDTLSVSVGSCRRLCRTVRIIACLPSIKVIMVRVRPALRFLTLLRIRVFLKKRIFGNLRFRELL